MRRLPAYGWAIEAPDGTLLAIRRDDGAVVPLLDRLIGTREAATMIGVAAPNFVRDWAARADFPAPVAELASGRVWLAVEVETYLAGRRPERPGDERIATIARRIAWWQPTEQTLSRPRTFIARVMAVGTLDEIRDVERSFGRRALRDALLAADPGIFEPRSWHYWLLALGLDGDLPLPARLVP